MCEKQKKSREIGNNQYPTERATPNEGMDQNLFSQLQQILTNKF
jgi:hypothetical protein